LSGSAEPPRLRRVTLARRRYTSGGLSDAQLLRVIDESGQQLGLDDRQLRDLDPAAWRWVEPKAKGKKTVDSDDGPKTWGDRRELLQDALDGAGANKREKELAQVSSQQRPLFTRGWPARLSLSSGL
jgi:hypothetical protein